VTSNRAAQKVQNGTRGDKVLIAERTAIRQPERTSGATGPCERITDPFQRLIEWGAATRGGPPTGSVMLHREHRRTASQHYWSMSMSMSMSISISISIRQTDRQTNQTGQTHQPRRAKPASELTGFRQLQCSARERDGCRVQNAAERCSP
jgi:hypothetical protein